MSQQLLTDSMLHPSADPTMTQVTCDSSSQSSRPRETKIRLLWSTRPRLNFLLLVIGLQLTQSQCDLRHSPPPKWVKISRINPFIDTKLDISIRYTPYLVVLGSNKKVKTREIFAAQFAYTSSWHLQIVQDRSVPLGLKGGDWGSLAQSADLMVSRCIQTGYFVWRPLPPSYFMYPPQRANSSEHCHYFLLAKSQWFQLS